MRERSVVWLNTLVMSKRPQKLAFTLQIVEDWIRNSSAACVHLGILFAGLFTAAV